MTPEEIKKIIDQQPFQPLRVHMSDGKTYEVPVPDFATVMKYNLIVGENFDDRGWPESTRLLNIGHITQIETIPTQAA